MLQLDQIWTILIEDKYSPVHDVIVPRPMSRDQKQKNAFYLNGLKDHTQPVCFARLCDCYYPGIRGYISHVDLSYTRAWSERNLKSSQKLNFTSLNQKMDENEESSVNVTNENE